MTPLKPLALACALMTGAGPALANSNLNRDSMTCGTYNALSPGEKAQVADYAIKRLNRKIANDPAKYDRAVKRLNLQCTRYLDTQVGEAVAGVDGKR